MESVNLEELRQNAYRVLGLTSEATYAEIEAAARMMRLFTAGDSPPTPNDATWLGPVKRMPQDIEYALMRLSDPASRVEERVWWFCDTPAATNEIPQRMAVRVDGPVETGHDAALLAFMRMLMIGGDTGLLEWWQQVLFDFRATTGSVRYRKWSLEVEARGDFDKQADLVEMASLHDRALSLAATAVKVLADDFLAREDFGPVGRCISLLYEMSGGVAGRETEIAGTILNRLEDILLTRCIQCHEQISLAWKTRRIEAIRPACQRVIMEYESGLRYLTEELLKRSDAGDARRDRVASFIVKLYAYVGDAYEACNDAWSAREALKVALPAASGTLAESRLKARIESLRNAQRPGQTAAQQGGPQRKKSGALSPFLVIIVFIGVIRGCLSLGDLPSSNPTRDYRDMPAYTIPTPARGRAEVTTPFPPSYLNPPQTNFPPPPLNTIPAESPVYSTGETQVLKIPTIPKVPQASRGERPVSPLFTPGPTILTSPEK